MFSAQADDQVNTVSVHEWAERPNYRKHSLCVLWTHSQPPPRFLLPSKLISSAGRKSLKISGVRALKTSCFSSENRENLARENNSLWHERGSGVWAVKQDGRFLPEDPDSRGRPFCCSSLTTRHTGAPHKCTGTPRENRQVGRPSSGTLGPHCRHYPQA